MDFVKYLQVSLIKIKSNLKLTHLPGFFLHAILSKVEGFFENFEKSLLHAILPEV